MERTPPDPARCAALQRIEAAAARPAIKPPPRAAAAAVRVLKPIARRFGPTLAELTDRWPEIAGERLAKLARPVRLTKGRDGGVLTLLARGPAATLVQAEANRIIERANLYCGQDVVVRLRVQQGPLHDPAPGRDRPAPRPAARGLTPSEAQAIARGAEGAADPALREALARLGRSIVSRAPKI